MCDYSLMAVPNRLAQEGEELVTYRFPTGSLGLASPNDLKRAASPARANKTLWKVLVDFFDPPQADPVCAVCIPPGAKLRIDGLPPRMQKDWGVGATEDVTFTQISASVNSYRDAFRFVNGRQMRLQELREGLKVRVLDLSLAEEWSLEGIREEFPVRGR